MKKKLSTTSLFIFTTTKVLAPAFVIALALATLGCSSQTGSTTTDTEQTKTSTTTSADIPSSTTIDLDEYTDQLVISQPGEYVLTGSTSHGVKIDIGSGEVTLHFNNAKIQNTTTAGLVATSGDKLTVDLMDGSNNTVSDGGSDETYDAAIWSAVPLTFTGNGSLTVNGTNQEGISTENADLTFNGGTYTVTSGDDGIETDGDASGTLTFNGGTFRINSSGDGIDSNADIAFNGGNIYVVGSASDGDAGIDSDDGYTINGGSVVALGTDTIETPKESSTQKTLALTLDSTVAEGSTVRLIKSDGTVVAEFTADQSFVTLIVSNPNLDNDTYSLYVNGEKVSAGSETDFTVNTIVNSYGTAGEELGGT